MFITLRSNRRRARLFQARPGNGRLLVRLAEFLSVDSAVWADLCRSAPEKQDRAVLKHNVDAKREAKRAGAAQDFVSVIATFGAIAAGVVLFEAALIPGMAIGAAAVLAPKLLPKLRLRPLFGSTVRRRAEAAAPLPDRLDAEAPLAAPPRFAIRQALAKTVSFRVIVTTLDFGANYVVIGEVATAAGLSAISLVVGPVFYLVHETAWNYFRPPVERKLGRWGTAVDLPVLLPLRSDGKAPPAGREGFAISRPLAKTITFRTIATTMEFATHYVVIGDVATAAMLSAFGFVIGPFVYLGHEMAWDYYGAPREGALDPPASTNLLAAPG
jgi:uncharacterized membrane protein